MGTAFVDVGEKEPTQGRVLVFQVTDSKYKIDDELYSVYMYIFVCESMMCILFM